MALEVGIEPHLECAILSFTFNGLIVIFRSPIWAVVSCHTIFHRRHTMGSIRKRGNTYQAQVRLSGGRHASKSFKTRSEATNWSREAAYHLSQEPERFDERVTLRDVIRRFIKDTAPLRRSGVNEAIRLNRISRHVISSIPVSKITSSDLSKY